jgi:hypothetical protein
MRDRLGPLLTEANTRLGDLENAADDADPDRVARSAAA